LLPPDRRRRGKPFLVRREAVDPRCQNRLYRRCDLSTREWFGQTICAPLPGQDPGLDEGSDTLLEEGGVPRGPADQLLLEKLQRGVLSEKGPKEFVGALRGQRID